MKKTKKAISLILAFAMIFTAMLGCMTVSSFAGTEGQSAEGPKLVDYSIEIGNDDPPTYSGSYFIVNLEFDKTIKVANDSWILNGFNISVSGSDLTSKNFQFKKFEVSDKTLSLYIETAPEKVAMLVNGRVDISLKSNYYDAIISTDGTQIPSDGWTDISTVVPTGLKFIPGDVNTGDDSSNASKTFAVEGKAIMRGATPVQIAIGDEVITVNIHTHSFIEQTNEDYAGILAKNFNDAVAEKEGFSYEMEADGSSVILKSKAQGADENIENAQVRTFEYTAPNDEIVQSAWLAETITSAEDRAAEIAESNSVAQSRKDALKDAIEQAKSLTSADMNCALDWQKAIAELQSAVDGAQDNAITTTSVTRSNGTVSLSLIGGDEWIQNISEVKIGEKSLNKDADYKIGSGKLTINSTCFDTVDGSGKTTTARENTYDISIEATGYADVTQNVTVKYYGVNTFYLRVLDGKGNVKAEKEYSIADLESREDVVRDQYYNTACSMTGLRTFRGDGVYLTDLIDDLKPQLEEKDITLNPDTTMIKLRTNDQVATNDDPNTIAYYNRGQTTYDNLMQDRYWFPTLFTKDSELKQTVLDNKANGINEVVRKALGESVTDNDKVKPMLAFDYTETVFTSNQDKPTPEDEPYDKNLAADKRLRFLFGTKMEYDSEGNIVSAARETTTWMASYQVYGIDLVDASIDGPKVTFTSNVDDPEITVITGNGNGYPLTANEDGSYSLIAGDPYTYTATKEGYKTLEGKITLDEDGTVDLTFKAESSSSGGGGGGGGSAVTNYTVTFDSNGGSSVAKQTVASGKTASKPADPTKEGYTFGGWYTDKELTEAYDFGTAVKKSITLYAKWNEEGEEPGTEEPGTEPGTGTAGTFTDVAADSWYAEYVTYLADKGIVNGKTETTFEPNSNITRAEFIKIIAGVAGADVSGASSSKFSDVAAGSWYAPYVAWGVENGLINGVSDTYFDPNGRITRQDMATLISRYADFAKFELPQTVTPVEFADGADIASYAKDAVAEMQKAGIINGKDANRFAPEENATRA